MRPMTRALRARWALAAAGAVAATMMAVPGPAADAAATGIGAGVNAPKFNDSNVKWWYSCTTDGLFKVDKAKIVMWSSGGNRVKGFHFKYRVVAAGSEGQPITYSNWSDNAAVSFKQGTKQSIWMTSGPQGQTCNPSADWDLEVKLKYPRSLRTAWRYKYRLHIPEPSC